MAFVLLTVDTSKKPIADCSTGKAIARNLYDRDYLFVLRLYLRHLSNYRCLSSVFIFPQKIVKLNNKVLILV